MKKVNNRYRNNNNNSSNNTIYSLNYKFDSNSVAGKISGTALDLIKRYNDLAKDAHSNNDYVTAEIFRQYAEHYRKIVTEINERKNAREQQEANDNANAAAENQQPVEENATPQADKIETPKSDEKTTAPHVAKNRISAAKTAPVLSVAASASATTTPAEETPVAPKAKKSFHVIEINQSKADEAQSPEPAEPVKQRRVYRRKAAAGAEA